MSLKTEVTFTPATHTDITALADLINSSYRAQGEVAGWTHEVGLLEGSRIGATALQSLLAEGEPTILLMRRTSDAKLVGCISIEMLEPADCYLSLLAIDPEQQASGHGRILLAEAETFAYTHGARMARMTVIKQREDLIAWYERRGYRQTGQIIPFPYQDPGVGIPLRDDLELAVLQKTLSAQ